MIRDNSDFSRNMETLTLEKNVRISQEINNLLNGVYPQIESAISTAISESIITKMQDVVETVLARQLGNVSGMSKRPHNSENDVRNPIEDNSHQCLLEP